MEKESGTLERAWQIDLNRSQTRLVFPANNPTNPVSDAMKSSVIVCRYVCPPPLPLYCKRAKGALKPLLTFALTGFLLGSGLTQARAGEAATGAERDCGGNDRRNRR